MLVWEFSMCKEGYIFLVSGLLLVDFMFVDSNLLIMVLKTRLDRSVQLVQPGIGLQSGPVMGKNQK